MSMKNVARRGAQHLTQLQNSIQMEEVVPGKREGGKPCLSGVRLELTLLPANHDLPVASLAKSPRKVQQLPLTASQTLADIDMSDFQWSRGSHT
jgi:hypothetical protein